MSQFFLRRELEMPAKSPRASAATADIVWSHFIATTTNRDLITIVVFCSIGMLVAINLMFRLPDLSAFL